MSIAIKKQLSKHPLHRVKKGLTFYPHHYIYTLQLRKADENKASTSMYGYWIYKRLLKKRLIRNLH